MNLTHILVFTAFAWFAGWVVRPRWRGWVLLGSSIIAIYWLQPSTPIRNLDFWFPTASITLAVFVWAVTQPALIANQSLWRRSTLAGGLVIFGIVLAIGLTRYLGPLCCLTPSRPPDILRVVLALGLASIAAAIPVRLAPNQRILPVAAILLILGLFIVMKYENLGYATSAGLRSLVGQPANLASAVDLRWLGFSYLAFRMLHVLRDFQLGKLPAYGLNEFVTYAIFFPAYTAGPIDRSQRFVEDLRLTEKSVFSNNPALPVSPPLTRVQNFVEGNRRILLGIFKKFVLADSLALLALNGQNAAQTQTAGWRWILLYAYTFRIYFDFAGYTDIALGLGRLLGFNLPENFDRPYLRQNLTAFWNSWHITLAQWFRSYFFNPVTRAFRLRRYRLPVWAVILAGQIGTMLLIGLWHGIAWNFVAWGTWHGLGLFIHNRWSDWIRLHPSRLLERPRLRSALQVTGWLLTFHYVALGWVWFALADMRVAWSVMLKLFGFA
jgi:D-alanyl-lipoteichoic acid acyltransferase DltB (MBOAT superfamily)